ncbi:MAG TPA: TonB family protein [Puia sp.]|nr:TonB family protein [Puia sp.]
MTKTLATLTVLTGILLLFMHVYADAKGQASVQAHGPAQRQSRVKDTIWYDGSWRACAIENSIYFRIKSKTDSGWKVEDHYRSGKLQMSGIYSDDSLKTRQGVFRWYDDKGTVSLLATYDKGKANGRAAEYWENGRVRIQGNDTNGQREGIWLAYFESGKLAGKAVFHAGKQTALTLYHADGSLNRKDTIFNRDSEFPGGLPQYTRFLNKSLRYPDSAVVYEIQGTVLVRFKVLKNGKVSDLQIVQPVNKYLDAEAMRVMRLMPDWEPAILAGVSHDSYKFQPVVFTLNDQ